MRVRNVSAEMWTGIKGRGALAQQDLKLSLEDKKQGQGQGFDKQVGALSQLALQVLELSLQDKEQGQGQGLMSRKGRSASWLFRSWSSVCEARHVNWDRGKSQRWRVVSGLRYTPSHLQVVDDALVVCHSAHTFPYTLSHISHTPLHTCRLSTMRW